MEFLSQLLPIIVYLLLIVFIIIGIILGIKLIITIDKVNTIVDEVNNKIEKISPLLDTIGMFSMHINDAIGKVVNVCESMIGKLFLRNSKRKRESEEDE